MWYNFNMGSKTSLSIQNIIEKKKVVSFAELKESGASGTMLKRMSDAGEIQTLGSGIYASSSLDPFIAAIWAASKYYPQAVISGLTALQIHGLAQEFIEKVDVDIPRESSLRNKMLNVHRVPKHRIVGITSRDYHGEKIRIYDIERTLCDAYLIDPGGALFFKALKRYVRLGKIDSELLHKYDVAAKTKVLSRLRQELADA